MTPSLVPLRVTGAVADSAGGGADPTVVVVVVVSGGCGADALDSTGGGAGAPTVLTVDPNVVAIGGGTRCLTVSSLKAVFIRDTVPRSEGLQHQWTTNGDCNV